MKQEVSISMRSGNGSARELMQEVADCGARVIQLDALHEDFCGLSASGRRDVTATIRRIGLHASGVDFLVPQSDWEQFPDRTLQSFSDAVAIAVVVGNVPIGTLLPDEGDITMNAINVGHRVGVLISTHGTSPPRDPQVGWHLPVSLLAKIDRPMEVLSEATHGPLAVRLKGEVVDDTTTLSHQISRSESAGSTLQIDGRQVELRELRGVLDAMGWNPTPIVDAAGDEAVKLIDAWQFAGPW